MSDEVIKFLLKFKQVAASGGIDLVPRPDTIATLNYLGYTKKDLEEILMELSVTDYCRGPLPDEGRPGELWEFGKNFDGYEVYIKLKAVEAGSSNIAKCISFHISTYPLKYPYKGSLQE